MLDAGASRMEEVEEEGRRRMPARAERELGGVGRSRAWLGCEQKRADAEAEG